MPSEKPSDLSEQAMPPVVRWNYSTVMVEKAPREGGALSVDTKDWSPWILDLFRFSWVLPREKFKINQDDLYDIM